MRYSFLLLLALLPACGDDPLPQPPDGVDYYDYGATVDPCSCAPRPSENILRETYCKSFKKAVENCPEVCPNGSPAWKTVCVL